jgi:AcrR family transcriptional regulator
VALPRFAEAARLRYTEAEIRFRINLAQTEPLFRFSSETRREMAQAAPTAEIAVPERGAEEAAHAAPAERAMRADARRNRERILGAARLAFAESGRDVQIDEVAERAGVGIGTMYRHFPTKAALAGALAREHFEAICAIAEDALGAPGTPAERFESMIWDAARLAERDAAIAEVMSVETEDVFAYVEEPLERLMGLTAQLVDAAVKSGELRPDASAEDIPPIMCGLGQVISTAGFRPGAGWQRYLTIALDGLRAGAPGLKTR